MFRRNGICHNVLAYSLSARANVTSGPAGHPRHDTAQFNKNSRMQPLQIAVPESNEDSDAEQEAGLGTGFVIDTGN
jgi:hypothetical protein